MAVARVTARCHADLEALPTSVVDDLLTKLETVRAAAPETGERILALRERPCYSLHAGRYRAATWYDRERGIIWLVGAGVHRADSSEDFYNVIVHREQTRALYPTDADYVAFSAAQWTAELAQEAHALRRLRAQAVSAAGGPRIIYSSPHGLYAEVWAEAVPGLAILALRMRVARLSGAYLSDPEWAILLRGPLTDRATELPDPDGDRLFRYFEEYVEP